MLGLGRKLESTASWANGQNKSDLQTSAGFLKALKEFKITSTIDLKVNKMFLRMQSAIL